MFAPLFSLAQQPGVAVGGNASNPYGEKSYLESITEEIAEEIVLDEEIGSNGYSFEVYDAGINTEYGEYGSSFFMGKFIMFSSRKMGGLGSGKNEKTGEYSSYLFCTDINKNGNLQRPLLFSRMLNSRDNQASVAFTPDEKTMFFTESPKDNDIYKLYVLKMSPEHLGHWESKQLVSFNAEGYSIENPHVTADGKTLYFASNMPGTTGGFDIFAASIDKDGSLGEPKPVEGKINTKFDEKYPFTSKSGKHLYFSSTGHKSLGGYDVFASRIVKGYHKEPRNLGTTLNSRGDDISFIPASKTKGYLTSNRSEGLGGFDIYKTDLYLVEQTVSGKIMDLETNAPLTNTIVKLYDEEGNEVAETTTTEKATYKFKVEPYELYTIKAEKEGFDPQVAQLNIYNGRQEKFNKNILLSPAQPSVIEKDDRIMIVVDNIYFDYDKSSIKTESSATLNKIAAILNAHPSIKINIDAHTDTQGEEDYNLKLSEARAKSTKAYLMSKGISADRMISTGYGESRPMVNCNKCSEKDHENNRRIEFVIVE